MQHLFYNVRNSVVPINFSLLTITVYSSVRTKLIYNNTKYSVPFHDVKTEFDIYLCIKCTIYYIVLGSQLQQIWRRWKAFRLLPTYLKCTHTQTFMHGHDHHNITVLSVIHSMHNWQYSCVMTVMSMHKYFLMF